MELATIEPKYQKWLGDVSSTDISTKVKDLSDQFSSLIFRIIKYSKTDPKIEQDINDIRIRLLYIKLAYYSLKTKNTEVENQLQRLTESMNLIEKYDKYEIQKKQKNSLNLLTLISIIVLPLTLIASYFGMNFGSMGCPTTKKGILTIKYGQIFVFALCLLSIILSILILQHYYKIII